MIDGRPMLASLACAAVLALPAQASAQAQRPGECQPHQYFFHLTRPLGWDGRLTLGGAVVGDKVSIELEIEALKQA